MAKTVKRTMYYPTFNTKTNEFDYKEVTHERPMTKKEKRVNFIFDTFWLITIMSIIISVVLFIIACVGNFATLGVCALGVTIISFIIWLLFDKIWANKKIYPIVENMEEYGFETEILQWEQIAQEQNEIAEKWRAEHEFEELIRKAKLSANCNDIAQAAKYYAEHYINK